MVLQLLCFLLAAPGVLSIPYMDLEGERMSLNHRAYRQPSPFSQDIFDPSFVVGPSLWFLSAPRSDDSWFPSQKKFVECSPSTSKPLSTLLE